MSYSGNRTHAEREMKEHGGRQPEKRRGDGGLHTEQGEALRATGSEFYEVSTYDTKYVKGSEVGGRAGIDNVNQALSCCARVPKQARESSVLLTIMRWRV